MSKFVVERANGALETVEAEEIGVDDSTLFFVSAGEVVKTFNNYGGWLSVAERD